MFDIPDIHMWFSILMVCLAMIVYANDKLSMELSSVLIISGLMLFFYVFPYTNPASGETLTLDMLTRGFSNSALLGVISLLVLGQAIVQTGALNDFANIILKLAKKSPFLAIASSLIVVTVISGFLNNTPVVVIFIPIIAAMARTMNMPVSKLMIPLSFASILGGMTTLIGSSTNLLVGGIIKDLGLKPLDLFEFTHIGVVLAASGLVYIIFIVPRMLPDRLSMVRAYAGIEENNERLFIGQIEVSYSSPLVGAKIDNNSVPGYDEVQIRVLQRGEHAFLPPFDASTVIRPKDVIIVAAEPQKLAEFFSDNTESIERHLAAIGDEAVDDIDAEQDIAIAEIVVSPSSRIIGKTLEQASFRSQYNCVVLGIERHSRMMRTRLTEVHLAAGDVLLVMGRREDILLLQERRDFLLMEWTQDDIHSGKKAGIAMFIFSLVVGSAAFGILPITIAAFAGIGLVLLSGSINLRQAGRAIDMKIILIIAASIALGTSLQETGGAEFIAHSFVTLFSGSSPLIILSALFFFMVVITNILSNNATAVIFTPIAYSLSVELAVEPRIFILAVIFACNCSFITPIGYQTNLMVMGPGHNKFMDFVKTGLPLAIIIWASYVSYVYIMFDLS